MAVTVKTLIAPDAVFHSPVMQYLRARVAQLEG